MGHSSIQITVDTYGHLIPGADIAGWTGWIRKQLRNPTQPQTQQTENDSAEECVEVIEEDSNPDMLIQSPATPVVGKEDKGLSSADSGKVLQNPHHPRTRGSG